jgi:hypothetical protein
MQIQTTVACRNAIFFVNTMQAGANLDLRDKETGETLRELLDQFGYSDAVMEALVR